ncbi:MAG: hypothetical protein WCW16_01935 [Candidatus Magasanikbacteria bacterium]
MHIPAVQHTLYIFERMHDHLPPLIPSEILELFEKRLEGVRNQHDIALEEVEQIMAEVGKKIWPYMRAFEDVHKHYTDKLGQELLHQRASTGLKRKLQIFKEMGGTYQDVYRGSGSDFLGVGERQELVGLLIDLKHDIRRHATQAALSHDRPMYEAAIDKYGKMIEEINTVVEDVKKFADEIGHDNLKQDIYSHVNSFDHGFSLLGPRVDINEVKNLKGYYQGKKDEKKIL